jgi:ASPIC/UnbV protein
VVYFFTNTDRHKIAIIPRASISREHLEDKLGYRIRSAKRGGPRDAVGPSVFVTANGSTQRADVLAGGSFASSSDQRPHFGLGKATKVDKIESVTAPAAADRFYVITKGRESRLRNKNDSARRHQPVSHLGLPKVVVSS